MFNNTLQHPELTFHHVGLLVANMEESRAHYQQLFGTGSISDEFAISTQDVKVCFVKISSNAFIELVQPLSEASPVFKLLKKNISYYHLAYKVLDIKAVVHALEQLNYKPMEYFKSEAFEGKRCIFLFSPEAHLIELIEE